MPNIEANGHCFVYLDVDNAGTYYKCSGCQMRAVLDLFDAMINLDGFKFVSEDLCCDQYKIRNIVL